MQSLYLFVFGIVVGISLLFSPRRVNLMLLPNLYSLFAGSPPHTHTYTHIPHELAVVVVVAAVAVAFALIFQF